MFVCMYKLVQTCICRPEIKAGCLSPSLHLTILARLTLCVQVFYLHVCMCTGCIPGAHEDHKRTLDLLELELWMVAEPPRGCLGSNVGPLQWQQVFLTTKPSLQPFLTFCFKAGSLPEPRAHHLATLACQKARGTCLSLYLPTSLPELP